MEKYRYNPAAPFTGHLQQPVHKNNNGKSLSLARGYLDPGDHGQTCFCFESDDDSADKIRLRNTKRKLARGCMSNLMICAILVGYTFIGAVIFLIVEGDSGFYSISGAGRAKVHSAVAQNRRNVTAFARMSEETRAKTVENIWEITVSLNILYRENWTRLAAQEMTRFQEQLVQRLTEDLAHSHPHAPASHTAGQDWNLAKAFLYSLTVLTTIGTVTALTSLP